MFKRFTKITNRLYRTENVDFKKIDITDDVDRANIQMVKVCSLLLMIVFAIMLVLSFFLANYAKNRFFYTFETVGTLAVLLAGIFLLPKQHRLIMPFVYLYVSLMHFYGIYIGILNQQSNLAVTSCLFLLALPLMFIDNPVRMIVYSFIAAGLNIMLMIMYKESSVLIVDLTDVLFSWLSGLGLAVSINRMKIRSFVREHEIALERDTDGLTSLWNKNALVRRVSEKIPAKDASGAFFIIDLDHFKQLNDTLGHVYGDKVLVETAKCLTRVFDPEKDIIGRFGGDEFIIYSPDADGQSAARLAGDVLREIFAVEVPLEEKGLQCSIGIALCDGETGYDALMVKADKALYVTKEAGRFGYAFYSGGEMRKTAVKV